MSKEQDITIIVRSSGESTEEICLKCIKNQYSGEIEIIRNVSPFHKALIDGYTLGVAKNKKYTLFIDADVIIAPNALNQLYKVFEGLNEDYFFVKSYTYDWLRAGRKPGGIHAFKTFGLEKMLEYKTQIINEHRPETALKNYVKEAGLKQFDFNQTLSYHDFFQYHHDIYRKVIFRMIKSPNDLRYLKLRAKLFPLILNDYKVVRLAVKKFYIEEREDLICDANDFNTDLLGKKIYVDKYLSSVSVEEIYKKIKWRIKLQKKLNLSLKYLMKIIN